MLPLQYYWWVLWAAMFRTGQPPVAPKSDQYHRPPATLANEVKKGKLHAQGSSSSRARRADRGH